MCVWVERQAGAQRCLRLQRQALQTASCGMRWNIEEVVGVAVELVVGGEQVTAQDCMGGAPRTSNIRASRQGFAPGETTGPCPARGRSAGTIGCPDPLMSVRKS